MKKTKLLFSIKTLVFCAVLLANYAANAQEKPKECQDLVYLKDGSLFRGKIEAYTQGGELEMTTWSGGHIKIASVNVDRIVQKCKDENPIKSWYQPYSFKETGWYHASRFFLLTSQNVGGMGFQHSSGYKFKRLIGAGIGGGIEKYDVDAPTNLTYPIFAELRGYFLPKKLTPYYAIGAGYGISNKTMDNTSTDGNFEKWRGGWMAQGELGYRIGNHAFIFVGINFQHKTRTWKSAWFGIEGKDSILYKRMEIGLGIQL